MAADYRNRGWLVKNKYKKADKHPDLTGKFTDADGNPMQIAAWLVEGEQGPRLNVVVTPEYEREDKPARPRRRKSVTFADLFE